MRSVRTKQILKTVSKIPHIFLLSGTPSLARPEEVWFIMKVLGLKICDTALFSLKQ